MEEKVIEIRNVSKYFSKVIANKDVSFDIKKGEVVALLGENGAGKSTIMKCLYGLYSYDEGQIFIDGKEVHIKSPRDAISHGIAMIQQHFSLVHPHTVTENIILGSASPIIDIKKYEEKVKKISKEYGFALDPKAKIQNLSVGEQQKVEILKALYLNARVLIMDEPTAVLTPQEADTLMEFIKNFTSKGNSVVFITHKMREVMEVADKIVVMKLGKVAGIVKASDTNEKELSHMMMAEGLDKNTLKLDVDITSLPKVLSAKNLKYKDKLGIQKLDDVSFDVHGGEIFGVAGVSGNGQDELSEAIAGMIKLDSGNIVLKDTDITKMSVRQRIDLGLGYSPLDRLKDGMVGNMTLSENMMLKSSYSGRWVNKGFLRQKALKKYTTDKIINDQIKASGESDLAKNLSGGNQQKVVLSREVDIGREFLLLNQPTRGLDVGAVERIHKIIIDEKNNGKAVLLVSTEIAEIFEICSRFMVMYRGKIMGIFKNGELTTEQVGLLMAGVNL